MATEQVYLLIFGAVILVVVFVAVLLLAIQRLRRRKAQLLSDLKNSPRLNSDRAFNRLAMARREADILGAQGTDVARARELIAQSQSSFDMGQNERSYELAQSAHEALVTARQGRPLASSAPVSQPMTPRSGTRTPAMEPTGPAPGSTVSSTEAPVPVATGLPRNRVESQFEMRLLDSDLGSAKARHPNEPATLAAIDFQAKAQTAFAAGQYTEAFRFALKGRRGLGGNVEAVAPGPGPRPSGVGPVALDPGGAADRAASGARCPNCGYPTTPDDVFCRGCGAPRAPATCPRCGTPRTPADTFCGRCGERFS
jgi:hypothetical protein